MLDREIKEQLKDLFASLEADYVFDISSPPRDENREDLVGLLEDVAASAPAGRITCRVHKGEQLGFALLRNGVATGICFRGIPTGHEFTSLLLAVLNSDGKGKNMPDRAMCDRVKALKGEIRLTTYVSLECVNCPDVVQSLNIMALLNEGISHEMVDGALFQDEAATLKVQAVPSVFAGDRLIHAGRAGFGDLLEKLEKACGSNSTGASYDVKEYDVIVAGGGPAGVSASVYSARKGLKVALLAEKVGGQVRETVAIENLISVPRTTGARLTEGLRAHVGEYDIDLMEYRRVEKAEIRDGKKYVTTATGETFAAPTLIIATGAGWRRLNVPGEAEYTGRGVAFCPHCDGPFYRGRHVAVIGGGNSGIEAALDLSGICSKVTVFEFLDELKADRVLQDKARQMPNVEIFTSSQTLEVVGDGEKVTALRVKDRQSGEERLMELDGVFIQIGMSPNSAPFRDVADINRMGEIETDAHCRTSRPGVYAAGDVSTVPYKQIIISMGEGAKAALSAFEDRLRN
ncbi:MAG: alkyl hydroperoxide reductase subunit F [Tannerellaceae bacterium]|jgi:alkyl hydroperoxide reductase subunit F|nr:alkyl hydroperoxide reductase subunit F [Tannerellaceae bacterium]